MNPDTRKMIERTLEGLWPEGSFRALLELANRTFSKEGREAWAFELWGQIIDALAESKDVIVAKCQVIHEAEYLEGDLGPIDHGTWLCFDGGEIFLSPQFVGTSGPALAIIVPLPPQGDSEGREEK